MNKAWSRLQEHLYRQVVYVCPDRRITRAQRLINVLILVAVFWTVVSTEDELMRSWQVPVLRIEIGFAILFLIEYFMRLSGIGANPSYAGVWGRMRWMCRPGSLLDLAAILPVLLLPGSDSSLLLRLFRVFRVIRLSRMTAFARGLDLLSEVISERRSDLIAAVAVAGMLLLFSASALYVVEGEIQPEAFGSIPRSAWWAIATLTTVGYGDVYPVTLLGRLIGGAAALAGIGVIAMPTGILSAAISDAMRRTRQSPQEKPE
jgi:voltage-gated potassium channel